MGDFGTANLALGVSFAAPLLYYLYLSLIRFRESTVKRVGLYVYGALYGINALCFLLVGVSSIVVSAKATSESGQLVQFIVDMAMLAWLLLELLLTSFWLFANVRYGVVYFPARDALVAHWKTWRRERTELFCGNELKFRSELPERWHRCRVPYELLGQGNCAVKIHNSLVPIQFKAIEKLQKFTVATDLHTHQNHNQHVTRECDAQAYILAGDLTDRGDPHEFAQVFGNFLHKQIVVAPGNHDQHGHAWDVYPGPNTVYRVGDAEFFAIDVISKSTRVIPEKVDKAVQFIQENIDEQHADVKHRFIVVHQPVYSPGLFGAVPYFSERVESLLDKYGSIRAVFTGHDHCFSAFKRGAQFIFVCGVGGGNINNHNSVRHFQHRAWPALELHGPQKQLDERQRGFDLHLDSFQKYTRTDVAIGAEYIVYTVRELRTLQVLQEYKQQLE